MWAGSNAENVVLVVNGATGQVIDTLHDFGFPYRIFDARSRAQKFLVTVGADSLVATAEMAGSPSPRGSRSRGTAGGRS